MKYYKVWTHDLSAPILIIKAETLGDAIAEARRENTSYTCGEEYKQANKCKYFSKQKLSLERYTLTGKSYRLLETVGICLGTRERDQCKCNGNKAQCDFYPERRRE